MGDYDKIIEKYSNRLSNELDDPNENIMDQNIDEDRSEVVSADFSSFLNEYKRKKSNWYVNACITAEKFFKYPLSEEKYNAIEKHLKYARLKITPNSTMSFAFLSSFLVLVLGIMLIIPTGSALMFLTTFIVAGFVFYIFSNRPKHLGQQWKIKTSSQMIISIFYLTTYMRHNSNLELALKFTADHIDPPISLDFMEIVWKYETGARSSVKEALDEYLDKWRGTNLEFIESVHLVESSLLEGDEQRRIQLLDKALDNILSETYEKMLHYAQELHSPITMVTMLGVILPMLTLIILPLAVSFMPEIKWFHLFAFYDVILPLIIFYLVYDILSTRPSGNISVGSALDFESPEFDNLKKFVIKDKKDPRKKIEIGAFTAAFFIWFLLFMIGLSPLIIRMIDPTFETTILGFEMMKYAENKMGETQGPYGVISTLFSYLIPLSFALSISVYMYIKSYRIKKIKDSGNELDKDITSSLYQLGNRLGDGVPAEIAIENTSYNLEGTITGKFFKEVTRNLKERGMGLKDSIFDKEHGAFMKYPSALLETAMKILIETSSKNPLVASLAMINISNYLKEIHKVEERLKDIMSDILGTIKSQISFVAPVITGVVVAITSMISLILLTLTRNMSEFSGGAVGGGLTTMFDVGVPTYYFQMVVGIYVIEIIVVLTILYSAIKDGGDKTDLRFELHKNLLRSGFIYCALGAILTLLFSSIATSIMSGL